MYPEIALPEESQGQRAIDLLGTKLPDVAAWHNKTEEQLRALLLREKTLWVDRRGRLFNKDSPPPPKSQGRGIP